MRAKSLIHLSLVCGMALVAGCRGPDTELVTPLSVVNWYPSGSATCVARETGVWVTLSAGVVESSFTAESPGLFGPNPTGGNDEVQVAATRTYDAGTATVKLVPDLSLTFDTVYVVRMAAGIAAEDGATFTTAVSSTFRTLPQSGCAVGPACKVDADCAPKRCSVTGACVNQCAVPDDCPAGFACNADTCQ